MVVRYRILLLNLLGSVGVFALAFSIMQYSATSTLQRQAQDASLEVSNTINRVAGNIETQDQLEYVAQTLVDREPAVHSIVIAATNPPRVILEVHQGDYYPIDRGTEIRVLAKHALQTGMLDQSLSIDGDFLSIAPIGRQGEQFIDTFSDTDTKSVGVRHASVLRYSQPFLERFQGAIIVRSDARWVGKSDLDLLTRALPGILIGLTVLMIVSHGLLGRWLVKPIRDIRSTFSGHADAQPNLPSTTMKFGELTDVASELGMMLDRHERSGKLSNNLRAVVESAAIGVLVTTHDELLFFNRTICDIVGVNYKDAEKPGFSFADFVLPQDRLYLDYRQRRATKGTSNPPIFELRARRVDGRRIWLRVRVQDIEWEGSEAFLCWVTEITARRQSEMELEENRAILKQIFESVPIPLSINSAETGRFLKVNPAAVEYFGASEETILSNLTPQNFYANVEDLARFSHELKHNKSLENFEYQLRRQDTGELRWCITSSADINYRGEPAIVSSVVDITKRKQAEENFERSQAQLEEARAAAEGANHAKSLFLAAMSHEIRTPMNGVIGMIDLLGQSTLKDDQQSMLRTIKQSAFSLLTIIDDILDFSKIEAGKLDLEEHLLTPDSLIEEVGEILAPLAEKKGVSIFSNIDPAIPSLILGDPVRLKQILLNIAGNAVKFTEHGSVLLRTDLLGLDDRNATILFSVKDTGIGISESALAKLFEAFSQAEDSTTRRFGGTGLGLTISQRLAEMMGGRIEVESTVGEGSEFSFTLTFPIPQGTARPKPNEDLKGINVLAAASDLKLAEIFERYLSYHNATLAVADNIDDVTAAAERMIANGRAPDIMIIGWGFPADYQRSIHERLRALPGLENVPLLVNAKHHDNGCFPVSDKNLVVVNRNVTRLRSEFLNIISTAVAKKCDEGTISPAVKPRKTSTDSAAAEICKTRPEKILVAEDNAVNQTVIVMQLEKLGFTADITGDGEEALAATRRTDYDLLLTDCHMPILDGLELTAAIREDEKTSGRHLPIIAITANALQGEAEHCLKAGMDDYVSKPVELKKLVEKLEKWLPNQDSAVGKPSARLLPSTQTPAAIKNTELADLVDYELLAAIIGNDDRQNLNKSIMEYWAVSKEDLQAIEVLALVRDSQDLIDATHNTRGAAQHMGATVLARQLQRIEDAAAEENWAEVDQLMPELNTMIHRFDTFVAMLSQELQTGHA